MPRFHNVNGVDVQFTAAEEIQRDAEEANYPIKQFAKYKVAKFDAAEREYIGRSLVAAEGVTTGAGRVFGNGSPKDKLAAISVKANARGNAPMAKALAGVHDKLETLQVTIDATTTQADLDTIDVTDNMYW
jgi:hypothetical protein